MIHASGASAVALAVATLLLALGMAVPWAHTTAQDPPPDTGPVAHFATQTRFEYHLWHVRSEAPAGTEATAWWAAALDGRDGVALTRAAGPLAILALVLVAAGAVLVVYAQARRVPWHRRGGAFALAGGGLAATAGVLFTMGVRAVAHADAGVAPSWHAGLVLALVAVAAVGAGGGLALVAKVPAPKATTAPGGRHGHADPVGVRHDGTMVCPACARASRIPAGQMPYCHACGFGS